MKGINLSGKTAIVTGGNTGIGLETVRALARAGVSVIAFTCFTDCRKKGKNKNPSFNRNIDIVNTPRLTTSTIVMKKYIFISALCMLSACFYVKITPIQGKYAQTPVTFTSESDFETVWDKLIDLFMQKGISIKLIDRSSGIIVSDRAYFPATYELKNGGLKDPDAFLVLPKYYYSTTKKTVTVANNEKVSGEWNVRIKEKNGVTSINVNIVNVRYYTYNSDYKSYYEQLTEEFQSTGNFEKIIADFIR